MERILYATLVAAALALAATQEVESDAATSESPFGTGECDPEPDDEGDSAPFTIVVEHADGWRCGGSLVSLRTALTSARCARGRGARPPRELWALAPAPPAAPAARRVARLALAAPSEPGRDADLAVLELESPFGGAARARPILMATLAAECSPGAACHAVRALGRAPRLRIVDAVLAPGEACTLRAPGWSAARDAALCLVGPALCASDWGAGVVCGGKLCGVVSRSVPGARPLSAADVGDARNDSCGDTHVAQSVARWRRFLHCAHTLRSCGRSGGECAQLCTERRLLHSETSAEAEGEAGAALRPAELAATEHPAAPLRVVGPHRTLKYSASTVGGAATKSVRSSSGGGGGGRPTRSTPTSVTQSVQAARSARPAHEFEPNRPDFKGELARTSRVYLKAGEYGDNAADYGAGGEDSSAGVAASDLPLSAAPVAPMAVGAPPPPAAEAELAARRQPAIGTAAPVPPRVRSGAAWPPRASMLLAVAELLNIL